MEENFELPSKGFGNFITHSLWKVHLSKFMLNGIWKFLSFVLSQKSRSQTLYITFINVKIIYGFIYHVHLYYL